MDQYVIQEHGAFEPQATSSDGLKDYETRQFWKEVVYTVERCTERPHDQVTKSPELENDSSSDEEPTMETQLTLKQFYQLYVKRKSQEDCWDEFHAPQRSLEWLQARKYCITASNFGAAVGHNVYESPQQLAINKIWNSFQGNAFTHYGTYHEPDAAASLATALRGPLFKTLQQCFDPSIEIFDRYEVLETGLLKWHQQPWMAVSPDGILLLHGRSLVDNSTVRKSLLIEYKCPARLRDCESHPYAKHEHNVPEYYMDQMQGIMGLFHKYPELLRTLYHCSAPQKALFVVWQPKQMHCTLVPFQEAYYTNSLEPSLRQWYFKQYLPLAFLKHQNLLIEGTGTSSGVLEL